MKTKTSQPKYAYQTNCNEVNSHNKTDQLGFDQDTKTGNEGKNRHEGEVDIHEFLIFN